MKIAMIASEIGPFAKTGGLADVVETLSLALERRGHELVLVLPAYRSALGGGFRLEQMAVALSASVAGRAQDAALLRARLGKGINVYLVRADGYFDREFLYGTPEKDYPDNLERFAFFCRAALEVLRTQPVDIIHCHDWQAALAIVFLKAQASRYPAISEARTVLTAHNLGFQGIFAADLWSLLELDPAFFNPAALEYHGNINLLKGALIFADKITTVSPSYAREIMETEQGFGLEGVLRERAGDVAGILNGVDYSRWNPETDTFIAKNYGPDRLAGKRECKWSLQCAAGLPARTDVPLFGMISRLTSQKGIDLVESIFPRLMARELQLVVLGSGERRYERFFLRAAAEFPLQVAVRVGFDEPLAHQIEAGADFFLMPSHYEPCGLNQMFSLKYGTVPIVRSIGGLKDTVEDCGVEEGTGTGFVFGPYQPTALLAAVERALKVFVEKKSWTALRRRAMSKDFSWDRSAEAYDTMYRQLCEKEDAIEVR